MITGFNTDIEHDGVVYHVQTEDKGVNSPLILSLVYSGGAILASKRSRYEDLIAAGFDEAVLADRLKRQHRLICAAINAGRIEDLKRMGVADGSASGESAAAVLETQAVTETQTENEPVVPDTTPTSPDNLSTAKPAEEEVAVEPPVKKSAVARESGDVKDARPKDSPYTVYDSRRKIPPGELAAVENGLILTLTEEEEFYAGQTFTIRVLVQKKQGERLKPMANAALSVKILGTTFRPKIYSAKTARDGIAEVSIEIPSFSSGRAAIVLRAAVDGEAQETRRVIYPAT